MGAKEQSGRTWPSIFWARGTTMEIHISDLTHKFQSKTRLDAKANSELYKSKRVCSVLTRQAGNRFISSLKGLRIRADRPVLLYLTVQHTV